MNPTAQESLKPDTVPEDKYATAKREREKHADAVLTSRSRKKIVVAGPGTGKTHLFKRILEGKRKTLTLTFVNSLVEDLSLELCGISDVKTLHGFSRAVLKKATNKSIEIFSKLTQVIREDAKVLLGEDIDFDTLFHNRCKAPDQIEFYRKRKNYYGNYYGFADIVFGAVRYFDKDKAKIPEFEQVMVDEFQDFNALEVSLIDLLAEKSPILLAGDDDQALYESLKSASPSHIRKRHGDDNSGYASFCLPYCSRCTRVIVEAANDIIRCATEKGYLSARINKRFQYFDDRDKDAESSRDPKITCIKLHTRQIPWFIQNKIENVAEALRGKFNVLVISPTRTQSRMIVDALKDKGFRNVQFAERTNSEEPPTLLDGLKLLIENKECNLGSR